MHPKATCESDSSMINNPDRVKARQARYDSFESEVMRTNPTFYRTKILIRSVQIRSLWRLERRASLLIEQTYFAQFVIYQEETCVT